MVSPDLPGSKVTEQIALDQRDLDSTPIFERAMDHHCQTLVSKLETLDPSLLPNCTVRGYRSKQLYYKICNGLDGKKRMM